MVSAIFRIFWIFEPFVCLYQKKIIIRVTDANVRLSSALRPADNQRNVSHTKGPWFLMATEEP